VGSWTATFPSLAGWLNRTARSPTACSFCRLGRAPRRRVGAEQILAMLDRIRQMPGTAAPAEAAVRAFGGQRKEWLPILRMNSAECARWK
jgi:hypothetical protein